MSKPSTSSAGASAAAAPRHPIIELLSRYRAIFQAVWAQREQLTGPKRLADEVAFLPAALSLQETPAHPAPRRMAIAICALFVIALGWSVFGQVDIVAVAPGRIVVSERTKTLQPLDASVVKRVLVKDGDVVSAGQVLVELDGTNATADGANLREQWTAMWSEEQRTAALLGSLGSHRTPVLASMEGLSARDGLQLQAEWQDITAKLAKLEAEHARRQAEFVTVQQTMAKLQATLPLARQREADFQRLVEQGFIGAHAGQDRTRERIEQERDLATQQARLSEALAALAESENSRRAYVAETQRSLSDRQAQASSKREQIAQERSKTEQRERLTSSPRRWPARCSRSRCTPRAVSSRPLRC